MRNTCKLGGVSFHPSLEVNHSVSNRIMMIIYLCNFLPVLQSVYVFRKIFSFITVFTFKFNFNL